MKKSTTYWTTGISLTLLTVGVLLFIIVKDIINSIPPEKNIDRDSAIKSSLAWARLNTFPTPKRNLKIKTRGTALTRGFIIEFSRESDAIEKWLSLSPGTKNVIPIKHTDGSLIYNIKPKKAVSAKVYYYIKEGVVKLVVSWS